jgi:curved DNA-binding protein CbpA
MIEINEANEVLSDASSRKSYDKSRGTNIQSGDGYFGEESNDIPPSFDPLDHDWGIALRYYPDLTKLEARLSKISWRLAYSLYTQPFKFCQYGVSRSGPAKRTTISV